MQTTTDPVETVNSAFSQLEATIKGLKRPQTEQLESVAELMAIGVTHHQVNVMYSHQGVGPFMMNGAPNISLIEQEKSHPGSVLGPTWQHPRYVAALEKFEAVRKAIRDRLEGLQVSLQGLLSSLDDGEPVPTVENSANANPEALASEISSSGESSVDPRQKVLNALRELPHGETENAIRDHARMSGASFKPVLQSLLADGLVESCEVSKRGTIFQGYRLAGSATGSAT